MKFWQSVIFFLIPGLYGVFAKYLVFPFLVRLGMTEESAYNTVHLSVFIGLFFATIFALQVDGWALQRSSIKERLRIKPMDSATWKLTLVFLILYLFTGLLLNILTQFVYEQLDFWPPDADILLTNIPILLFAFVINIISEELWWRGYILPRQELEHGKVAWIINGVLWSFFHIMKWWAVPFMVLRQWMIPFLVQRTKITTPAILFHFVSNGIGVHLSILPLLTA
jgi:membrane protease YdiL (CAAX protease family)